MEKIASIYYICDTLNVLLGKPKKTVGDGCRINDLMYEVEQRGYQVQIDKENRRVYVVRRKPGDKACVYINGKIDNKKE